jgi:membrane protease YdiL (CAAX protease family)
MLTPGQPLTVAVLAATLIAVLTVLVLRAIRKDRREYSRFKRYRTTRRRQAMFRKWVIESFAVFGGASVVVLALTWKQLPLLLADVEAWPAVVWLRAVTSDPLVTGVMIAVTAVLLVGSVVVLHFARGSTEVPTIGDITALLPRNRAELRWGAALSVNAGVVEELMFRLAMPLLLFGVTSNAVVAVAGSIVVFAALHLYQGVAGIAGSAVIGAVLMAVFLGTGSIVAAIALHIFIDLRSLLLIPVVVFGVHRIAPKPAAARAAKRD